MVRFDWSLYLGVAIHLAGQHGEEYLRSAISRAYYAAFCTARERLEDLQGERFSNRDAHLAVINRLSEDSRPEVAQVGSDLDRLHRERNRADYDNRATWTTNEARLWVALAHSITSAIPNLKN